MFVGCELPAVKCPSVLRALVNGIGEHNSNALNGGLMMKSGLHNSHSRDFWRRLSLLGGSNDGSGCWTARKQESDAALTSE